MSRARSEMNRREDGQITVMVVGFFIVVALLAVVVVNSSSAFLQRQELNNVADGAALAAADALKQDSIYEDGIDKDATLDPDLARQIVDEYLASTGNDVAVWQVMTDGDTVHVHLERIVDFALAPPGWRSRTTITADAAGVLRVGG